MNLTYKLIGNDGKEYGPVTADQLQAWAREGRIVPQTQVQRSDRPEWVPASTLPELGLAPAPAGVQEPVDDSAGLERALKSSASWFYWIAGLSVINSIAAVSGFSWRFIVGLGITQVFDHFGAQAGASGPVVALVLNCFVAGVFVLLGVFAHKGHTWSFVAGMILFGLDGVLTALLQQWINVAFHAFVLFMLFKGLQASRALRALAKSDAAGLFKDAGTIHSDRR